jgi:hypothetical protein
MPKQFVVVEAFVPGRSGAHPEHPIYLPVDPPPDVYPPGIWGGGNEPFPTPPIYFPTLPPLGTWGGRPPEYVDIGGPGAQPEPSHPIAPGGLPPLGTWGGANEPFPTPPIYIPVPPPPDSGLSPEHPIYIPVAPAHPIVLPPLDFWGGDDVLTDEAKEKLVAFLTGNLPPFSPPDYVSPV